MTNTQFFAIKTKLEREISILKSKIAELSRERYCECGCDYKDVWKRIYSYCGKCGGKLK